VTQFTTLLGKSDMGNVTVHIPDFQASPVELAWQLKRTEVPFWFRARIEI